MNSRSKSGKARARMSKRRGNLRRQSSSSLPTEQDPNQDRPSHEDDVILGAAFRALDLSMTASINEVLMQLSKFLYLLKWAIQETTPPPDALFPNTVSAVSCFARAFQGLQASAWLCMAGFYVEARTMIRGVYESAGLGRMLAKDPEKAQKWLHDGEWVPDRNSRAYAAAMTDEASAVPYREYYQRASKIAHPTAMSTLHYAFNSDGTTGLTFGPGFDSRRCVDTFREIVIEAAFVCFAFRNALVDEAAFPPDWLREVFNLAREVTGADLSHLDRDWARMDADFDLLRDTILDTSELEGIIDRHPNSYRNIRRRLREVESDSQNSRRPDDSV